MYRRKPNYLLWFAVLGGIFLLKKQIVELFNKLTKKS